MLIGRGGIVPFCDVHMISFLVRNRSYRHFSFCKYPFIPLCMGFCYLGFILGYIYDFGLGLGSSKVLVAMCSFNGLLLALYLLGLKYSLKQTYLHVTIKSWLKFHNSSSSCVGVYIQYIYIHCIACFLKAQIESDFWRQKHIIVKSSKQWRPLTKPLFSCRAMVW